ncbi:Carrier protein YMC1, mitochondrial [Wickerhamiella sorbophila]|uniref:Carrier protein YMC1, mitochondrial n=1 Tax=Wickerhamiella sorbophila TaxID=45607 RepID=A0A2T0FNV0_9ASCO|nr:Carrier protein YMC1, mitochondrial [Wickerhamiella sorbophila]PRT56655.1 Carrier protein YMC1, mitochondrial [Wickerhamiella sorbophila]
MSAVEAEWDIVAHGPVTEHSKADVAKDVFAGTMGGFAQVLSGQPFDTTKVRLQSAPEGTYSGAMDVVRKLVKNEGFKGFYKGTMTPLVGVGACVSVQFAVNEGMKRYFGGKNKLAGVSDITYGQLYVSGACAGFANAFLASPIEQIRIRLQTQTGTGTGPTFRGPIDCIKQIWQAGGMGGIFRGFVPTIIRESHGMAMYFMAAEACVKQDMKQNKIARTEVPSWKLCMYGGVAGITMWLSVYPIDVIKSKMQTDALSPAQYTYKNMRACFQATVKNGYGQLFKGFAPTLLRAFPVNACTFLAFEVTRRYLS